MFVWGNPLRPNDPLCVSNLIIIGSDNGMAPDRRQSIIRTNAGILLIGPVGTNFSESLAATMQLYEWFSPSVRPSVCPSVWHTFLTMFASSYHHEISWVITNDRSGVHEKGQRSKAKVTEVNTQLSGFRTVTPVWIQIWWWNDEQSLVLLRRGALLFSKVICQISRSHG